MIDFTLSWYFPVRNETNSGRKKRSAILEQNSRWSCRRFHVWKRSRRYLADNRPSGVKLFEGIQSLASFLPAKKSSRLNLAAERTDGSGRAIWKLDWLKRRLTLVKRAHLPPFCSFKFNQRRNSIDQGSRLESLGSEQMGGIIDEINGISIRNDIDLVSRIWWSKW